MRLSLMMLLLFYSSLLFSQKKDEIPPFGKVDKSEMQMNECDFDKNAEAVVLFDVEVVKFKLYTYSAYTEITHHVRIKYWRIRGWTELILKYLT